MSKEVICFIVLVEGVVFVLKKFGILAFLLIRGL